MQECRLLSGLVTFIAAYHYLRIYTIGRLGDVIPSLTGVPFHDDYRYRDGNNRIPLVPCICSQRQTRERRLHFWLGHPHRSYLYIASSAGCLGDEEPHVDRSPFNDAYRYMDWLLTVPLLLIEILLVMKLDEATFSSKAWNLGVGSALMIASGYYGELVVSGDLTPRWMCWFLSMIFFLYIVNELLNGLVR